MASGLTFEYILKHDTKTAHCASNAAAGDRLRQLEYIESANGYAEPGYADPEKCVLFGNWNHFSHKAYDLCEQAGYALEWSDEWSTCGDCGKAVRTSPDSYGWQASYVLLNECEIVCVNCIDWSDYLSSIEDDAHKAVRSSCDPSQFGYRLASSAGEFENGFHPGQNDKPADILKRLHAAGHNRIVFRISGVGQFDVEFEAWEWIGTPAERLEHVIDAVNDCRPSCDDVDDKLWHGQRNALAILESVQA